MTLGSTNVIVRDDESVQLELSGGATEIVESQTSNDIHVKLQILCAFGPTPQPNPQGRLAVPITARLPINEDFGSSVTFVSGDVTETQRSLEVLAIDDLFLEAFTELFNQQTLELLVPDNRVRVIGSADVHVTDNETARILIINESVQAVEGQPPATLELELEITGSGQGSTSLAIPLPVNLSGNSDYSANGVGTAIMEVTTCSVPATASNAFGRRNPLRFSVILASSAIAGCHPSTVIRFLPACAETRH